MMPSFGRYLILGIASLVVAWIIVPPNDMQDADLLETAVPGLLFFGVSLILFQVVWMMEKYDD